MEKAIQQVEMTKSEHDIGTIQRYLVCGYFFLAYFEPYLNGVLGSLSKYYILLLMAVLWSKYKNLKIQPFHWCFLGWLALKIISVLWTTNFEIPELHIFSQLGMVALLIVITAMPIDRKTITAIVTTMWLGSTIIGVLSLFFSHPYHDVLTSRQVLYLFGQEADPNNQAAFLLPGLTISLYCFIVLRKYRAISILVILVNTYSLFMTGSRGGLVSLFGVAGFLLFTSLKETKIKQNIKIIVLVVFVVLVLGFITIRFLNKDIFERLFSFSDYEGGSERSIIWSNGWDLFTSGFNSLFGAGWGAYFGYNNVYKAMHNTFLSMLCDVGTFGFLMFFISICRCFLDLMKKSTVLPVLLLLCAFIPSFFIEAINKRFFWNAIIFLLAVYVNYKSDGEDAADIYSIFYPVIIRRSSDAIQKQVIDRRLL